MARICQGLVFALCALVLAVLPAAAQSQRIRNPIAIFAGLDKITGRIISFEVNIDETVQFGSLQITPRVCWTRPPTEQPNTTAFVEVDEIGLNSDYRRIFTGWMFAASPGLHGVEHSIFDVWMTDCKGGRDIITDPREPEAPSAELRRERQQPRAAQQPRPQTAPPADARIDVAPPRGVPVAPQQPTQRFFPTNQPAPRAADPTIRERGGSDR